MSEQTASDSWLPTGWTCAACGGENPAGTRFCGHCGTPGGVKEEEAPDPWRRGFTRRSPTTFSFDAASASTSAGCASGSGTASR